jgi:uncharacterized protein (UPF0332 family)
MPFDWQQFASFSDRLCRDSNYQLEAAYRVAASRYYYAAHWAARQLLESALGITFATERVHKDVVDKCLFHVSPSMRKAGERLKRLMKRRNVADYEAEPEFQKQDCDSAGFEYLGLIGALGNYRRTLPPPPL